jgi:DNA invertase Pin-like site-specific DNA recombinase
MPMLRAVLLGRVSTTKSTQDASASRQILELRELATRQGWEIVAQMCDRLSGSDFRRPGLLAMLDMIVEGRADILVVHDLDRLGRDCKEMLTTVDAIHLAGGNLYVRDKNIDTTSAGGRLTFTIFAAVAEFQRRSNRERVIAGLEHARKKGVRLGRPVTKMSKVRLHRAIQLRQAGHSWTEIAAQLQAEGLGTIKRATIAAAVRSKGVVKPPQKIDLQVPEIAALPPAPPNGVC